MREHRNAFDEAERVRIFIDHWEFSLSWQIAYSGFTGRKLTAADLKNAQMESQHIRWDVLTDTVIEHLDDLKYIGDEDKEVRNVDVYASTRKSGDQKADNAFFDWLEGELDPLPGFQVHHFSRKLEKNKAPQCNTCGAELDTPELEKGLKTKMACDLLSHAVENLYDIAVLFADDPELAPSVISVQEIFDKKVIHIGLQGRGEALRSAAWGHILMNDLIRDLFKPDDFKKRRR